MGKPPAIPALLSALSEQDSLAHYAAFTALNRIGRADSRSWPAITKGLQSEEQRVREGTTFAVRETYEPPLTRALADVVRAPGQPAEARVAALELLAQIHRKIPAWKGEWWAYHPVNSPPPAKTEEWEGTKTVLAVVRESLKDRDQAVRHAAVQAVRDAKISEAVASLRRLFESDAEMELKCQILVALGVLKDTGSTALVKSVLEAPRNDSRLVEAA